LIIYDSVATVPARAAKTKNFVSFQQDLANDALPQWFFMTPNMSEEFPFHRFANFHLDLPTQRTMATTPVLLLRRCGQRIS
jgi:hypothetical protein